MRDLHDPFAALMDFCGKYCFDIISLTCFTTATFVSIVARQIETSEATTIMRHHCFSSWMFTILISLLLLYSPRVRNHKFKTCRLAVIHWIMLSTVAPLIIPFIIALRGKILLSFLYVTLLTLFLTIKEIPRVIKRFEDSHKDQD